MLGKAKSAAVIGIDAFEVDIEVSLSTVSVQDMHQDGLVSIVGLPDMAVRESRDRIRSALSNSGFRMPRQATVVNLAPADLRKAGSAYDLGISLGLLAATGVVNPQHLESGAVLGELALDGAIRPVRGILPAADMLAARKRVRYILVPEENATEAALASGGRIPVYAVKSLKEAVDFINTGHGTPRRAALAEYAAAHSAEIPDFSDVKGQHLARRALEISAAGGHNVLMSGPPGTGKSMLAMRLPGILPPMSLEETLETSRIHSVLGMLSAGEPILSVRPFRAPHHTISDAGLIGGGHDPRPGEISLAHNGVLFLDELPEFRRSVLEVLRQPLENGEITISRASGSCHFPARFILIAAMNPCPCGLGERELGCKCSEEEIRRYQRKISGPLMDRIDLRVGVRQLSRDELIRSPEGESSAAIRNRVIAARERQKNRFAGTKCYCNDQLSSAQLRQYCRITPQSELLLRDACVKYHLSPRSYDRILKVSRTIADLAGAADLSEEHIFEAITYRQA